MLTLKKVLEEIIQLRLKTYVKVWKERKTFTSPIYYRGRRVRLRGYVRNRGTGRLRIFFAS